MPLIRLVYATRTEDLLDALARDLEVLSREQSPLVPTTLVVPNRNVESYLRLGIARRRGVAANLEVRFFERFVNDLLMSGGLTARLVERFDLQRLFLWQLHDADLLARPEVVDVRAYLYAAGDSDDAVDLRRAQLSAQLAQLFTDYAYSRPDFLSAWVAGRRLFRGAPLGGIEEWQRALWRGLFAPGGQCRQEAAPVRWVTLADLVAANGGIVLEELPRPRRISVFGFSTMAPAMVAALERLARGCDLRVYAFAPMALGPGETLPQALGADATSSPADGPLAWARPGRESLELLSRVEGCEVVPGHVLPVPEVPTLLQVVQQRVVSTAPRPPSPPGTVGSDGTVQVLACPDVRREAEIVVEEIWRLLEEDEAHGGDLRLNEIAVLVNRRDVERSLPHLEAAFRATHGLPFSIVDLPLASSSRVVEAARQLVDLPLTDVTRHDLLRLMLHPNVAGRFGEAPTDEWARWCHRLGIVRGADAAAHRGTYLEGDLLTWEQGLRRLVWSLFMRGEPDGSLADAGAGQGPGATAPEPDLLEEIPQPSQEAAAQMGLLARALLAEAARARHARLPLADWGTLVSRWLETYLVPLDDEDERAWSRALRALERLGEHDGDGPLVSYRVARELVQSQLCELVGRRGQHLAQGIVVSSFLPLRAIPFRVVFLLGLGEGQFPAADLRSEIDLRRATRQLGDVTPGEQDRFMFLETVAGCRQRLYLSYVARDPLTGEEVQPSSTVLELLDLVAAAGVTGDPSPAVRRFPLRRHEAVAGSVALTETSTVARGTATTDSPVVRPPVLPEVRAEAQARALREHLRSFLGPGAGIPDLAALQAALPAATWERLRRFLRLGVPPAGVAVGDTSTLSLSLTALRSFLECPLQAYARFSLGLTVGAEEEVAALMTVEDEPLSVAPREGALLLRQVALEALATGRPAEEVYQRHVRRAQVRGLAPTGLFGEVERDRHLETLQAWVVAAEVLCGTPPRLAQVAFGGGAPDLRVELAEPILLDLDRLPILGLPGRLRVELVGTTGPLAGARAEALWLTARAGSGREARLHSVKDLLRCFVDHVALAAAGQGVARPAHVVHAAGEPLTVTFAPWSRDEARGYLGALATALLGEAHDYLLPCEAVLASVASGGELSLRDAVARLAQQEHGFFSSRAGPVWHPERYPAPSETQAQTMVEARLGRFLADVGGVLSPPTRGGARGR